MNNNDVLDIVQLRRRFRDYEEFIAQNNCSRCAYYGNQRFPCAIEEQVFLWCLGFDKECKMSNHCNYFRPYKPYAFRRLPENE